MTEEFIPYEQALTLKELGFDEYSICFMGYYQIEGIGVVLIEGSKVDDADILMCNAPLYQQAFRWFREKHDLFAGFDKTLYGMAYYVNIGEEIVGEYMSYEEAELDALKKLIEIVKLKKDG